MSEMFVLQKDKNNHYKSLIRNHLIEGVKEIIQDGGSLQFMQILLSGFGAFPVRQGVSD